MSEPPTAAAARSPQNDLAAFADFVLAQRDEITRRWVTAVDRSPQVPASEDLTFRQLLDHLPQLCTELANVLKDAGAPEAAAAHSAAHGRRRWQQGFRIGELIRELSIIRRDFVGQWFDAFEEEYGELPREVRRQAHRTVHQFFDEVIVVSVTQFVEEQQQALRESETALSVARVEAEAAAQAKDNFTALISHELRTPLSPLLLGAATLAADPNLPEPVREFVALVERTGKTQAGLIDDLLDLSRMTSEKLTLSLDEMDLNKCLSEAIHEAELDSSLTSITPIVRLEAAPALIRGDEGRLRRAFRALVRNAINVSPAGSSIIIRTKRRADEIEITIEDNGTKLDEEHLHRLFLPFEEGRRSGEFALGEVGVGRHLAKIVLEAHGGIVTVEPAHPDWGGIIRIRMPALDPSLAKPKARLFVVEDHPATSRALQKFLITYGYAVEVAFDSRSALQLAGEIEFDLLICDLNLPDGNGWDLMKRLNQTAPVTGIAFSAFDDPKQVARSKAAGFSAHLVKGCSPDELLDAIENALQTAPRPV